MDKSSGWIQPVYESFVSHDTTRRSSRAKRSRKMTSYPRGSVNSRMRDSGQETADEGETSVEEDDAPMSTRTDEPTSSHTPPSTSQTPPSNTASEEKKTKPTCTIRLSGGRYRKEIELTMDSEVDNLVYRVLKCLDEECVEIGGLQLKGKTNPMMFLQQCLAPFASCFSYNPTRRRPKRRCLCRCSKPRRSSGMRKTKCADSDESNKRNKKRRRKRKRTPCSRLLKKCRRTVLCSRSCCRKDDVVLIEICPSQTTDTDVTYKKQKERGVGTDTSPELEILLNGRSLRCVAKKTGMKCKCTNCCPKSQKKAHRAPTKEETITEESDENMRSPRNTFDSGQSEDTPPRRKRSAGSDGKGKMSFERTYSLLVNSNYNPTWDSEYESTPGLLSNDFDVPRATPSQRPVRWRVKRSPFLYNARSEPFNVYSPQKQNYVQVVNMENWKYNCKREFVPRLQEIRHHINTKNPLRPITTSHKKKISSKLFFGSDYILELHETSESVEETSRDPNAKRQTVCIGDYLRLHKLFQRSRMSKMNLTSSNSKTLSLSSEDRTRKSNKQPEDENHDGAVLKLTSPNNQTSSSASNDKGKRPNKQQESDTHKITVLRNEFYAQKVFTKVSHLHSCPSNEHLSAASLPKEGIRLKSNTLFLKKFPPTKKSTNLLAFLKNIRSERKLSKDKEQVVTTEVKPIKSFSRKVAKSLQKLKIYLKLSRTSKTKTFSPVTLDKKQGMLNLSSLVSDSS